MKFRKYISLITAAVLAFSMTACAEQTSTEQQLKNFVSASETGSAESSETSETGAAGSPDISFAITTAASVEYKDSDYYEDYTSKDYTTISLSGSTATVSGKNASEVKVEEGTVTITAKGYYVLEGSFEGTVVVDAPEDDKVRLVLNGVTIKGQNGPAIYEKCSDKLIVMLAAGTENVLSDASSYADTSEDAADACLYAKDDLTINGEGTLYVTGNYKAGIKTKDDLKIMSGTINVTAADDAIKGHDSLSIAGGVITVSSGDDGIHSDGNVVIDDGIVNIIKSVEAVEGLTITVNAGTINAVASDDGFNATDGSGDSFGNFGGNFGGFPGNNQGNGADTSKSSDSKTGSEPETTEITITPSIIINGGEIYINSNGDGLDANGNIAMTGGYVYVSGAANDGNNATDYDGTFIMNGGNLIATGMSGMYQSISSGSSCYAIDYTASSTVEAGTEVTLKDGNTVIYTFTLAKKANAFLLTGDKLENGKEYTLTIGSQSVTVTAAEGSGQGGFGGFGGRGGFGGFGNFGGQNGFPEQGEDGERPNFDGQTPPEGFDGQTPPEGFDGQTPPEGFDGQTPPEGFNGQMPQGGFPGNPPTGNNGDRKDRQDKQ